MKVKKTLIALVVVIALIAGSTHWLLTEHNLAMEIYDDQLFPVEARFAMEIYDDQLFPIEARFV